MPERNGNDNVKHLFWIAGAIVTCVTVSWFLDQEVKAWNTECHTKLEQRVDINAKNLREDIHEIKADVKELLKKIKK